MLNKMTIQIVGWNSAKDLEMAINGLKDVGENVVIRYIDNNSTDESVEMIRRHLPNADIVELTKNKGFAEANNIGFRMCNTEFIMLHNPDVTVEMDGVQRILDVFKDEKVGAAQGRLYRDGEEDERTIDSVGIKMNLAFNGKERGAGEIDSGQYDEMADIDAVTGAVGIYRLKALREVAYEGFEAFDKQFVAYKEDVDLGWRLGKLGWRCMYVPITQGVHKRKVRGYGMKDYLVKPNLLAEKLGNMRTRYSLRNWVWMVIKNMTFKQAFIYEIFVDFRIAVFVVVSLVYWPLFSVWAEIIKGAPAMLEKRYKKLNK